MSALKAVDSATRRRNVSLGLFLGLVILVLVLVAFFNVSPETAGGHDSLLSK